MIMRFKLSVQMLQYVVLHRVAKYITVQYNKALEFSVVFDNVLVNKHVLQSMKPTRFLCRINDQSSPAVWDLMFSIAVEKC